MYRFKHKGKKLLQWKSTLPKINKRIIKRNMCRREFMSEIQGFLNKESTTYLRNIY
jgi:thermostable 8-oxoguanine DNA glycosylase